MSIKILMPALSPTMTEGNLAKWHVKEGDQVNPGDVIAEIETDKATMEVESIDEGIVGKILVAEGTEAVPVNETIGICSRTARMLLPLKPMRRCHHRRHLRRKQLRLKPPHRRPGIPRTSIPATSSDIKRAAGTTYRRTGGCRSWRGIRFGRTWQSRPVRRGSSDVGRRCGLTVRFGGDFHVGRFAVRVRCRRQPEIREPARTPHGGTGRVDLSAVQGSGPDGRIVKRDIDEAVAKGVATVAQPEASAGGAPAEALAPARGETSEIVKLSTMRKVIAQRMTESKSEVPHFYLTMDCELDELLKVRKALNAAQEDVKISVNDFVIRACAMGLMGSPRRQCRL